MKKLMFVVLLAVCGVAGFAQEWPTVAAFEVPGALRGTRDRWRRHLWRNLRELVMNAVIDTVMNVVNDARPSQPRRYRLYLSL